MVDKSIKIGGRTISETSPVYVLAEMACGHQGQPELAEALIDAAVEAGADGIQLELFDTPHNLAPQSPHYQLVSSLQFSAETWDKLFQHARQYQVDLFAFVYDTPSFELASQIGPDAYKLNSSDLSNPDLLRKVAGSGIPYTLGTGASSMEEIARSLELVLAYGGHDVILMHGVQNFPTPLPSADIGRIELLRRAFDALVGYADHTDADNPLCNWTDLLAIGSGACLVEKHIVMDRAKGGVDYQAALEPAEFKLYVENLRSFNGAMGSRKPHPFTESCHKYRKFQKKVATAILPIRKGELFCRENIAYLRHPEHGLSPFDMEQYFGRKSNRDIEPYDTIQSSDVSD